MCSCNYNEPVFFFFIPHLAKKVCVCVQVYISWWGLKPEYTQTQGDSCHCGGTKLRSPWVQKLINHIQLHFFFLRK